MSGSVVSQGAFLFALILGSVQGADNPLTVGESQPDNRQQELMRIIERIGKIEAEAEKNPEGEIGDNLKEEKANLLFRKGILTVDSILLSQVGCPSSEKVKRTGNDFVDSYLAYPALVYQNLMDIDVPLDLEQEHRNSPLSNRDSFLWLKVSISACFVSWFAPVHDEVKQGLLRQSRYVLRLTLRKAAFDDPGILWAYLYLRLACHEISEDRDKFKLDLWSRSAAEVLVGPNSRVDWPGSLEAAAKSDQSWIISDPLDAYYLLEIRDRIDASKQDEAALLCKELRQTYRSARKRPGPLGNAAILEWASSEIRQEDLILACKAVLEVMEQNRGNEIGALAVPALERLIKACSEETRKRYKAEPALRLALAHEYRLAGRFREACIQCDELLRMVTSKSRSGTRIRSQALFGRGLCAFGQEEWRSAADCFARSLDESRAAKIQPDSLVLQYRYRALVRLAESSSAKTPQAELEQAKKALEGAGINPEASSSDDRTPSVRDRLVFPPAGLIELGDDDSLPSLVLLDAPRDSSMANKGKSGSRKRNRRREIRDVEKAVESGLDWLARHQHPDGHWSSEKFATRCKERKCSGQGIPLNDLGVTGLALLAFLRSGSTATAGPYCEQVRKAVLYIIDCQDPKNGCLTVELGTHFMYNHGVAALALAKTFDTSRWPLLSLPLKYAVEYIRNSRNPGKAWRYNNKEKNPVEQNDVSVTGWMVSALATADRCGFAAQKATLREVLQYIDSLTHRGSWRTGYMEKGSYGSRESGAAGRWPYECSEAMTAVALNCRYLIAEALQEHHSEKAVMNGAHLIVRLPPVWDPKSGRIDYYFWFHGTKALQRLGGTKWKGWKAAAIETLVGSQKERVCARGSWDPQFGVWGKNGGRVYSTALCTMILQMTLEDAQ